MSLMGIYIFFIVSIAVWWLWRQGVMRSPWLEEGEIAAYPGGSLSPPPAAKLGLGVFLAVAGCLFSLMAAAYFMRAGSPDWRAPPTPGILWLNTMALIASSVTIQLAAFEATRSDRSRLEFLLVASGVLSLAFLLGQIQAWRELVDAGVFASSNPASAFFYLLTGAHGLHLIGGLAALSLTIRRAWTEQSNAALAASVELCAVYWHFLLFVWLLLFAMLAGKADALGVICRRILS
ncbi:cytochrome c oxidase subunit 3 [Methylocystis heyeri]|uniref:Cytochrome c oxidase subunit III n=1 Tax=Methylocystis heyeri TaxID=391905 RepID=A0A6B8KJ86_9HYPH|nr:cytochrome c oxidase subunit 3 [Methylocystis heyeri]QGM46628.1 cytochrome c oxidase subunit III [Methylocystis heyeri]